MNLNLKGKDRRNSQLYQQAQALPAHTWRATFQLYPRATVRWCTYSNVSTFHTTTEPATKKSFWSSVLVWVAVYSHVSKSLWNPYLFIIYLFNFDSRAQSPSSWKKFEKKVRWFKTKEKKVSGVHQRQKVFFSKKINKWYLRAKVSLLISDLNFR